MSERIPVNPDVLIWARESLGYTVENVAQRLKVSEDIINSWEIGDKTPTYAQLEKLAYGIYKGPIAVFFFPQPPEEADPKIDFRTLPEDISTTLPPEILKIYRKAKIFQINLNELYEGELPTSIKLSSGYSISTHANARLIARRLRAHLGITSDAQTKLKTYDHAFEYWREKLASLGVFVFKDAFHNDLFSGLCLYDERYPVISVNNSTAKSRQIFTIFHELAHLLFKSGGVDSPAEDFLRRLHGMFSVLEVKCNEFAGEFLLPDEILKSHVLDPAETAVAEIADKFKVSRELVLRKYLDYGIIDIEYYRKYSKKWNDDFRKSRAKESSPRDYYITQRTYLGKNYINLVFSKYFQKKIQVEQVADYLGIKMANLPTFETYVMR